MRADDAGEPDTMRAGHRHETWDRLPIAVLVILVVLVGLGGVIRLVQSAAELGPQIGDILTFDPHQPLAYDPPPQISAARHGLPDCVLDLAVMQRFGGSLVIESRSPRPDRIYRVGWAGRRTSDGPGDCGRSAVLLAGRDTLNRLAMAVGGYGVSRRLRAPEAPASQTGGASGG